MTRIDPAPHAGEHAMLEAFLDFQRATVVLKAEGLSEADVRRGLVPSLTTVGGMLRHLRWVEHNWFEAVIGKQECSAPWVLGDEDGDFRLGESDTLESLLDDYAQACERSRRVSAELPLEQEVIHPRHGTSLSVRWILLHMIEETARHAGQLDILRELLDGATGE
ncbi:DinB family protein [Pseudonocardiaceae bacterium YIM PH 21723]|nr:DinB family protein [Pseudonocardiaceae bacterium YIM PH 21723]